MRDRPRRAEPAGRTCRLRPGGQAVGRAGRAELVRTNGPAGQAARRACRRSCTPKQRRAAARRILLVLQGMDTAGKGGVTNHVIGSVRPDRCAVHRVQETHRGGAGARLPLADPRPVAGAGVDRRLRPLALRGRAGRPGARARPYRGVERRYARDQRLRGASSRPRGTTIVKCFLHISFETQRQRLLARLDEPRKRWKFNEADLDERAQLGRLPAALRGRCSERCNTPDAPWYVVPSDSKKYRNWAVGQLLRETLEGLDLHYPRTGPRLGSALAARTAGGLARARSADEQRDRQVTQQIGQFHPGWHALAGEFVDRRPSQFERRVAPAARGRQARPGSRVATVTAPPRSKATTCSAAGPVGRTAARSR